VKEAVSGTVDLFGTLRGELAAENEAKKGRELDYASEWRAKLKELELMVREITEALEREGESVVSVLHVVRTFLAEKGPQRQRALRRVDRYAALRRPRSRAASRRPDGGIRRFHQQSRVLRRQSGRSPRIDAKRSLHQNADQTPWTS
jgi:hypothetical protein